MDPQRFDRLARTLSTSGSRRGAVAALVAGSFGLLGLPQTSEGRKRSAEGSATGRGGANAQGPCGDGGGPANSCVRPRDCCTGICERSRKNRPKRCRCRSLGQPCTQNRNCCQAAGQELICDDGACRHQPTPPPPPTCPGQGQACATPAGTPCCPDINPDVVCASGLNPTNQVCQDCNQAPTTAGAYCQDPPGNQCCGGSPTCFVGVRVADNQPACYSTGTCRPPNSPCTADADCGGSLECGKGSLAQCGCSGPTPTFCGAPCP